MWTSFATALLNIKGNMDECELHIAVHWISSLKISHKCEKLLFTWFGAKFSTDIYIIIYFYSSIIDVTLKVQRNWWRHLRELMLLIPWLSFTTYSVISMFFCQVKISLFSSVVERWSCKPAVESSILSGGRFFHFVPNNQFQIIIMWCIERINENLVIENFKKFLKLFK